jgi:hypothetical protein
MLGSNCGASVLPGAAAHEGNELDEFDSKRGQHFADVLPDYAGAKGLQEGDYAVRLGPLSKV